MSEKTFDARKGLQFLGEGLFFDTCVWLSIYGPDSREHKRCFSDLYAEAIRKQVPIFINDFVVSEFHNRSIKIDYRLSFNDDQNFSRFKSRRKSGNLSDILESARDTCLNIIDECSFNLSFSNIRQVNNYLSTCAAGELDFTDSVIEADCSRRNLTLVTSDGDYACSQIPIITDNKHLLQRPNT